MSRAKLARLALRSTARHSVHGVASKLRREPIRSGALLGLGCLMGLLAGRIGGRPAAV